MRGSKNLDQNSIFRRSSLCAKVVPSGADIVPGQFNCIFRNSEIYSVKCSVLALISFLVASFVPVVRNIPGRH